ncbi:hypothetical protein OAF88_02835, partial [Cyclobacteriaceae bacterium]|nr:hypothetical protein [Cyclobacteriaceae bacterium]
MVHQRVLAQCTTAFLKGLDFDGSSSDYTQNKTNGDDQSILRRDISLINSDRKAQPWAFGAVFKWDGTGISSESTIWSNSSTGASLTDMHIRAYIESGGELAFKYGDGNNYIMRKTSSSFISSGVWYGLYIDYDGYVANGTGSDLATQYSSIRIRLVDLSTGAVSSPSLVNSKSGNGWTSDVNNRIQIGVVSPGVSEFDGQIASVVVTTLAIDQNVSDEEISAIILNPSSWLCNYKVGESYRRPNQTSLTADFALEEKFPSYSTRVWLMGDGSGDATASIKNQVNVSGTDALDTRLDLTGDNDPSELISNISGLTIPPNVIAASTSDSDSNGKIDQILVTLSETITDGSSTLDNTTFTVAGYTVSGTSTGSANDNQVLISLTESGSADTGATPNIVLIAGKISDGSNALGYNQTFTGTSDAAAPAILATSTLDGDKDGQIDQILVTLSEAITDASPTVLDNTTFTVAGYTVSGTATGSSSANDNQVLISLAESGSGDTDATPDVVLVTAKISDGTNALGSDQTFSGTTDGAAPVFSAITPSENSSVKFTNVGYTLSEAIAVGGSITYRRTGGSTDGSSPHAVSLSGSELSSGVRSSSALASAPTLTSGGIYMLEFNGTDLVGNVGTEVTVTGILYDGAAPTFVKAWQYDTDGDGDIDEIVVELSEDISDASVTHGDFVLGSGSVTGFSQASGASANSKDVADDDKYITLEVSVTGTATVSVAYTNNSNLADLAGNVAATNASITADDQALPAILSTSWQDTDRDGGIDRAVLTFSESVDVTDGGSGDGFGAILVNDGGAVTLDNADYAANSVTSLTLNFLGDEITGTSKSGLSITYDASGSNAIKDESGGTLEMGDNLNSLAYVDGAAPAIIAAETEDTNADGRIDRIYITFSETLDDSGISFGTSNFTFASHSFSVSTSGHPLDVGGDDQYVTLTLTEVTISGLSDYDTELTPALVLKANQIEDLDAATNKLSSDQSSFTVVDGAGPAIIAAITSDADADAKIDQIDLTFSENVDDSQGVDLASSSVTLGSSYVVSSINTGATADDDLIRVVVTEVGGSTYDTEETPTVTLVSSKIGDALNNQAITNQGAFTPSDGAAPVIVLTSFTDANGNGNIDRATLTFSEVIDVTDGVSGDGLDVTLVNDGTSVTLDNANYTGSETDNSGNSTLVLNFTNDEISGSTISGSTLTYTSAGSNAIKDESTATNEVVSQASLAYTDGVVPVITDASWQDADANGLIDRVVLTFSESVDVTDGVSGDGFGAILVNDGGAVTLDNADYAASGVMSLTLNFSGDQITGTAIAGLSVTYENSGSNSISDAS